MNKIITIGREFGSGGREIGRRLAQRLHIAYYDQEIISAIVKRTDLAEEYIKSVEERQPLPLMPITIGRTFSLPLGQVVNQHQSVFLEQSKVIREMAEKSDCVIVGRCGDYILRDMRPFRLFLYADTASKMERCRRKGRVQTELSDQELQQRIRSIEKGRANYYQFYTDLIWGEKSHYDLCLNTSHIEIQRAVSAIEVFLRLENGN